MKTNETDTQDPQVEQIETEGPTEAETRIEAYKKLSLEELEALIVDAEQVLKETKEAFDGNSKIKELGSTISSHRKDPKFDKENKEIKEKKDEIKEIKMEIKDLEKIIDEEILETINEKYRLEVPYRIVMKEKKTVIKEILPILYEKGRTVEFTIPEPPEETEE